VPLGLEVAGDGEDPRVVVTEPVAGREHAGVRVVELDAQTAAQVPERDGRVEPPVPDAVVVEGAQRLPGEVSELRVMPLRLELRDDDDREYDLVFVETVQGARVGQQDAGVENISAPVGHAALSACHHGRTYPLER